MKTELHHGPGGFGGEAPAPVLRRQLVADVRLPLVFGLASDSAVPDQTGSIRQRDRQLEFSSRSLRLLVHKHLDEVPHLLLRTSGPRVETEVARVGLICQDIGPVFFHKIAED